jgi:hypothetical protein
MVDGEAGVGGVRNGEQKDVVLVHLHLAHAEHLGRARCEPDEPSSCFIDNGTSNLGISSKIKTHTFASTKGSDLSDNGTQDNSISTVGADAVGGGLADLRLLCCALMKDQ